MLVVTIFKDHTVIDLLSGGILQFRVVDRLNFDFARSKIYYTSITCHKNLLFDFQGQN